ncbi:MAG TPA: ABC transporter ATP-binding protein [Longimicrobiales bacterium]|nr:ABC transporter ATP-binding protein [Longimicrobiales bacterium]
MKRPWPTVLEAQDPAVRLSGLTKRFRRVVALDAVDLTVPTGSVYLLAGPNGAGKTTTTRILLDLTRPSAGEVEVLGLDPHTHGAQTRAHVGYVPERTDIGYGWMRVDRLLEHHGAFRTGWDADYARELTDALEVETTRKFGKLSKGNARRVQLVMALAHKPQVLILDEPTDGLDPLMRERVLALLATHARRFQSTMMISTHLIHEADRMATHVAVIDRGRVVVQTTRDELKRSLRRYRTAAGPAEAPAGVQAALVTRTAVDEGTDWLVWGEESQIVSALRAGGVEVRETSPLTLEQAAVGFLSHGIRSRDAEVSLA